MRISDWSSDVCSSDLRAGLRRGDALCARLGLLRRLRVVLVVGLVSGALRAVLRLVGASLVDSVSRRLVALDQFIRTATLLAIDQIGRASCRERVCQYV